MNVTLYITEVCITQTMVSSWERENINLTIHGHHFHIGTFSLVTKRHVKFNSSFLFPWGELSSWARFVSYICYS